MVTRATLCNLYSTAKDTSALNPQFPITIGGHEKKYVKIGDVRGTKTHLFMRISISHAIHFIPILSRDGTYTFELLLNYPKWV